LSPTDVEEAGGGYFTMTVGGELIDEFSHHVLVFRDGKAREVHVPA